MACGCGNPPAPPAAPRRLEELERQLVEEETALRIEQYVEAKVAEALSSSVVQATLQQRVDEERARLESSVAAQLDEERRAAEEQQRKQLEEVEQQRRALQQLEEEARRKAQEEEQRKEEEERAEAERRCGAMPGGWVGG